MKVTDLFEVKQTHHDDQQKRCDALFAELMTTFKPSKTRDTSIYVYGTNSYMQIGKLCLDLPPSLEGEDLRFTKQMMEKHIPGILAKHMPGLTVDRIEWSKRSYYAVLNVSPGLRKKINGMVSAKAKS